MNEVLHAALQQLALGRGLLPVGSDKRPHQQALSQTGYIIERDSKPHASWLRLQTQHPDPSALHTWFGGPYRGLGLVTGQISHLIVIDFDGEAGLQKASDWGVLDRAHVRTRSGGLHWYLKHPGWRVKTVQSQTNERLSSIRGVDVRGDGGYVVMPPTCFQGSRYEALRDLADLDDTSLIPKDIRELLGLHAPPKATKEAPHEPTPPPTSPPHASLDTVLLSRALDLAYSGGKRNESGFWLALQLRDNHFTQEIAQDVLRRYADQVPETNSKGETERYTLAEALHSVATAYSKPARDAWRPLDTPHKPRMPLQLLEDAWPTLTPAQRETAARYIAGARGEAREAGLRLLIMLGAHELQPIIQAVEARKRRGEAVPGLNALMRMLLASPFTRQIRAVGK